MGNHRSKVERISYVLCNNNTDSYANSGESFCSSELSLDDSTGLEQLDDSGPELHTLENNPPHHHSSSGSSELLPSYSQINPIDKLYLMQNSYFTDP